MQIDWIAAICGSLGGYLSVSASDSIRNGFLSGAAGVAGITAMHMAGSSPALVGGAAAAGSLYAYVAHRSVRDSVNTVAIETFSAISAESNHPVFGPLFNASVLSAGIFLTTTCAPIALTGALIGWGGLTLAMDVYERVTDKNNRE